MYYDLPLQKHEKPDNLWVEASGTELKLSVEQAVEDRK